MSKSRITTRYNINETSDLDKIITTSYDNFTRLERRNLLIVSSITLISCVSGIDPSSGNAFGFNFTNLNKTTFYSISLALNIYFITAFSIYSWPLLRNALNERKETINKSGTLSYERRRFSLELPNFISNSRFQLWLFIHFFLPILSGVIASILCILIIA